MRKKVAKAIADGANSKNGKKAEALAQTALADLRSASDAIRDRVVNRDSKRSEAAKKAARTRKRNAAKRSAVGQEGRREAQERQGAPALACALGPRELLVGDAVRARGRGNAQRQRARVGSAPTRTPAVARQLRRWDLPDDAGSPAHH